MLTCKWGCGLRWFWMYVTWQQERAAFVHIASDGNVSAEGLLGVDMNGRWIKIWR
jgi:hypothetical protein